MADQPTAFLPVFEDPADTDTFRLRVERYGPDLLDGLRRVYGERATELHERVLGIMGAGFAARPHDLRLLDEARLLHPDWLQEPGMVGYVAYADRFAGTLAGVGERLDHLTRLGVTYLHLMPLLKPREGENDGGYAVADFRAVRPDLGTMDDLEALAGHLRERGISLVLDLVLNHVAAEHEWALRARAGDPRYRAYFHVFGDREQPDAFERTLPEVFPDFAPGNFTWVEELGGWVWTTFNSYQWDLDWSNPDVFCEFLDIILHLANRGVEVLRLDAIAFLWKRLGTDCQNQPEVHHLTRALRAAVRVVAPAVAFKAEAIVGPTDLATYLGTGVNHGKVSDMAYHNSLMVQLWSALASRDTRLTEVALSRHPGQASDHDMGHLRPLPRRHRVGHRGRRRPPRPPRRARPPCVPLRLLRRPLPRLLRPRPRLPAQPGHERSPHLRRVRVPRRTRGGTGGGPGRRRRPGDPPHHAAPHRDHGFRGRAPPVHGGRARPAERSLLRR